MVFKIGMKIEQVLNQVQSGQTKVNDKTKELIFNFCQNDTDGVISNGNELAMLNAWASGSEKVPMPKHKEAQTAEFVEGHEHHSVMFEHDQENNLFTTYEPGAVLTSPMRGKDRDLKDILRDTDGDGFADERSILKGSALAGTEHLIMEDKNLDGVPDDPKE